MTNLEPPYRTRHLTAWASVLPMEHPNEEPHSMTTPPLESSDGIIDEDEAPVGNVESVIGLSLTFLCTSCGDELVKVCPTCKQSMAS